MLLLNHLIEIFDCLDFVVVDLPAAFQDLHHDVVVNVVHEVSHFLVSEIESVELVFHAFNGIELVKVADSKAPGLRELVLHSLQFPQKVVDLLEYYHNLLGEYSRKR